MNYLVERYRNESRWINWRYDVVDGKKTKVPYSVSGRKASTTDPSTWSNYDQAILSSDKIGIIFTPDQRLIGIDIDHCLKDGAINHEQKEKIADFILQTDTYTEISPSGEGLHLFLEIIDEALPLISHKKAPYECYTSGRFFTFTGAHYGAQKSIRIVCRTEALRLLAIIGYPWKQELTSPLTQSTAIHAPDTEILERMFSSSNGDKIERLYNGDISVYKEDESSADMALCSHLAYWTGKNAAQMERIWLSSPLGKREKTQKRQDYRSRTINNAIAGCKQCISITSLSDRVSMTKEDDGKSLISIDELMGRSFPKARYSVEPFFEQGTVNMVSASPNSWKSWLLFLFSVFIASGRPVLDRFNTEKTGVMIINEEDSQRLVQDRFISLSLEVTGLPIYLRIANGSKLEKSFIDTIIKESKEKDIKVIMMDSLRALHNADENASKDMQEVLDLLKMVAREGITVIFTHHHRKKTQFNKGDDAEASRGSSAINAALSGHISLEEIEEGTGDKSLIVRHLKSKAGEKLAPFKIKINKIDNKVVFKYDGDFKEGDKKLNKVKDQILYILYSANGGWKSKNYFIEQQVGGRNLIGMALGVLLAERKIKTLTKKEGREKGISEAADGKANEKLYSLSDNFKEDINYDKVENEEEIEIELDNNF